MQPSDRLANLSERSWRLCQGRGADLTRGLQDTFVQLLQEPELHAKRNAAGFIYVHLTFDPERATRSLRLHIWPPNEQRYPSVPHTHSCHIESLILCGELVNTEYAVCASESGGVPLREAYCGVTQCHHGEQVSSGSCEPTAEVSYRCGDRYAIELGSYHSTRVPGGILAATFVQMSDFRSMQSLLIDTGVKDMTGVYQKESIPTATVRRYLTSVLDQLQMAGRPYAQCTASGSRGVRREGA